MPATAKKQVDLLSPSPEFLAAQAAWNEIDDRRRELAERIESMRLARSLAHPSGQNNRTPDHLRERAAEFERAATAWPRRFAEEIDAATYELAEMAPAVQVARDTWAEAQQAEADRLAVLLQDEHREIILAQAAALEALSVAMQDERDLHEKFRQLSPLPQSRFLPDMSGGLPNGAFGDHGSPAWHWRQRAHEIGILQ